MLIVRARRDLSALLKNDEAVDVALALLTKPGGDPENSIRTLDVTRQLDGPPVSGGRVPSWQEEYYIRLFSFETVEALEEWMARPDDPSQ